MRCSRLILLGLLLGLPAAAQGAVLTFGFEGVVDYVGYDPLTPIDVQIGDILVYEYTFDSDAPYLFGYTFPALGASITIGNDPFPIVMDPTGYPVKVRVQSTGPDIFGVTSSVSFAGPDLSRHGTVSVYLWDGSDTAINDWQLPSSPPDLSQFSQATWELGIPAADYNGFPFVVSGGLTRSYWVPEPTSAMLLGLSVLTVSARRRRPS